MGSNQEFKRAVGRKFVVACDGTWQNSDQGYDESIFGTLKAQIPSNITRIVRAIKRKDQAGIPQIVFYQRGVGSGGGVEDKVVGGITGDGVSELVREAYGFLANNINPESQVDLEDTSKPMDEIVLFGFSRGAFTARAISSLISDIGLLTHTGMENFWGIFGDWMKQNIEGRQSEWFKSQFGKKIPFTDPLYRQTLVEAGITRWPIPIRAVGVWDTVGSLGIPLPFRDVSVKAYSFVNTKVADQVEHAFQCLALDEHRNLFSPALWEIPEDDRNLKTLKQVWFPGVHSNVGGGYPDAGISLITLAWMVSQLEDTDGGILSFDSIYLDWLQDKNDDYYVKQKEPIRPWGLGRIYDSAPMNTVEGFAEGLLPITRKPGRYQEVDNETGRETNIPLKDTGECIHPCVRIRMNLGGLGTEEDSKHTSEYSSAALRNYELVQSSDVKKEKDLTKAGSRGAYWKAKDGGKNLPEETLGRTEIRLLKRSVELAKA